MKTTKTLLGFAVASTFGWAAAVHAGTGQAASWVAAGDEQYPPMRMFDGPSAPTMTSGFLQPDESIGSTAANAAGLDGGSFASEVTSSASAGTSNRELSGPDIRDGLAGSDGTYSEYFLVTLAPAARSAGDLYVIALDAESEELLSLTDTDYSVASYDVILLPGDLGSDRSSASADRNSDEPAI